jgi:hypothetical protein
MSNYNKIVNPITGRKVNANGQLGRNIISNYIQYGGKYSIATSLEYTNTLVFCHGNKNNTKPATLEWVCDAPDYLIGAGQRTQLLANCAHNIQDQNQLFSIFDKLEGPIRYKTIDYNADNSPDYKTNITNIHEIEDLWNELYITNAPIKNIIILNCGGFNLTILLPLLLKSITLLQNIHDASGFIKNNWKIIIPNMITLINTDINPIVEILTMNTGLAEKGLETIGMQKIPGKSIETMETELLKRDIGFVNGLQVGNWISELSYDQYKEYLDYYLNSNNPPASYNEGDPRYLRDYIKHRPPILGSNNFTRDIFYNYFDELFKFYCKTKENPDRELSEDMSIVLQNSIGAMLHGLGSVPEIVLYFKKIVYYPRKLWTAFLGEEKMAHDRGPYFGVILEP